jgi:hypothetical protein
MHGSNYHQRFLNYLHDVQERDLTLGVAMTDAKGDRSKRPGRQINADVYVHITQRRPDGVVIRGTKAIVTGAPYMHEFLVMPCRTHTIEDTDFAVCCAVPVDAPGVTIIARPAGRPGEAAAKFSAKYGQSTMGVTHTVAETPSPDLVLVPGGTRTPSQMVDDEVLGWLRNAHKRFTDLVRTGNSVPKRTPAAFLLPRRRHFEVDPLALEAVGNSSFDSLSCSATCA